MGRDRNTNTHRRANMAAGAISNALRQKQIAETMKNLADAIEYGEARHLEGVTSRAAVEALETELRQGKYRRIRAENRGGLPEREIEKPISADDIRSARLPNARVDSYDSRGLLNAAEQRGVSRGHARILEWLRGSLRSQDGWTPDSADLERLVALVDAIEKKGMPSDHRYAADRIKSIARERGRFARMGIRSDLDLQEALAEYVQFRAGRASEDPIKKAERELVGFQGLDFFPTPPALVDELVKEADIQPGMKVLEPSAGKGDIADAIRRLGGDVDTVELAEPLRRILEAKKHRIVGSDFTAFEAPAGGYDRIVMNPPFSNGMDADHVRLAFDMLKPGGRLVAITGEGIHFRSDAKARGFREWLEELGATATKLPEGSFKSAFRPTGVATRLVVIDKDADAPAVSGATIKPDLKVAEAPAAEEGPKEGDTKTEGGVAYVLRDGRWHRADPEPEAPASDITSPEVMPPPAPATFDQAVERAGAEPFAAGDLNWQGGYADDALDQLHARPDDFAMTTDGRWQRMEHYLARTDRTDEITRLSDAITGDHPEAHRSRWKRQLRRLADAMADQAPAPAPEPAPAPAEPAGPWEGFAKPEEYHTDRARESYGAISFSPEKRARSDRDSYVQDVNGLYQELYKLAETDEQKAVLAREMEAYRQAYLRHDAAVASARGRTMSPMITGGSNFPVHRNEKALRSEHNRIGEFLDWHKRARAAIRARLAGARTADQVRDDLWAMLRKDLTGSLATIAGIDMKADGYRGYDRSAFTSSVIAKLRRLAERGETDLLQRALDYIKAGQAKLPKPMFNDRSPIWQLMPAAETKATAQDAEPAGDQVVAEKDGVQVIRASSIGRVQIHFPGKPDEAMRAQLKGAGWRWSPSNSAWQRMDTDASVASAKRIIGA